jgi:pimeloyl-ACP methyl ester carboxylesterase
MGGRSTPETRGPPIVRRRQLVVSGRVAPVTTFGLVHGAWHGGWCWDRVAPELVAAGHAVVAVDLPCDDVSAGCADYAEVVLSALDGADDDVVLVAHSAGGLTIPLVAAARPVARMVFVSALLPVPGVRFVEQSADEHVLLDGYEAGVERDENGCRRWFDPEVAARRMYNGCTADEAAWAFARLRPQASTIYTEPSPMRAWPDAPVVDVRGRVDGIVSPAWAADAVPTRLGVESIVIDGAGHSSPLSHPRELARILLAG